MKPRRQRCPFCRKLTDEHLSDHIVVHHFPLHCTHCAQIEETHVLTDSSPQSRIPCPYGKFVTGEPRL